MMAASVLSIALTMASEDLTIVLACTMFSSGGLNVDKVLLLPLQLAFPVLQIHLFFGQGHLGILDSFLPGYDGGECVFVISSLLQELSQPLLLGLGARSDSLVDAALEVAHDWLPLVFFGNALLQNGDLRAGDDLSELEQTRELIWIAPERGFLLPRIQANILSMLVGIRRTWRYTFSCHCVR